MGLGGLFRKLRGDTRAMPDPGSEEFRQMVEGSALPGSTDTGVEGWVSAGSDPHVRVSASRYELDGNQIAASGGLDEGALREAGVPADSAATALAALKQIQQAFAGGAAGSVSIQGEGTQTYGNIEVTQGPSQTLDLRGMGELRERMQQTLRDHGVDPDSGQSVDASQVPGLQEALFRLLAEHGVDVVGQGRQGAPGDSQSPS